MPFDCKFECGFVAPFGNTPRGKKAIVKHHEGCAQNPKNGTIDKEFNLIDRNRVTAPAPPRPTWHSS